MSLELANSSRLYSNIHDTVFDRPKFYYYFLLFYYYISHRTNLTGNRRFHQLVISFQLNWLPIKLIRNFASNRKKDWKETNLDFLEPLLLSFSREEFLFSASWRSTFASFELAQLSKETVGRAIGRAKSEFHLGIGDSWINSAAIAAGRTPTRVDARRAGRLSSSSR